MTLACAAVVGRLAWLQVLAPDRYTELGVSQRTAAVVLPADRGSIFDRNGHELALSIRQHTVWADPRLVTDPAASAAALAPVLGADVAVLTTKLQADGAFVYLARKIDDRRAEQVEALDLDGVFLVDEPKRFAPSGGLARSVIGTVGLDNNGLSGLEQRFEERLTGDPGEIVFERAPDGRTIPVGRHHVTPAARGDDLVLTIDRSMQYEAERALASRIEETGAEGGMAVVMRPDSGEILAMANVKRDADTGEIGPSAANMAVTNVFEPGSVNKVITVAGALEEGMVNPDTPYQVPDNLQVSVHRFSDHDPHPPTRWTVSDILQHSSNVGTIMIAQQLGKGRIDQYLRKFGFGEKTGLGFPGEPRGLLLDPGDWAGTSIGSIPIGQSISVTALQMLLAYNTIANGGIYVAPKLVDATVDASGRQEAAPASERHRVVSERTAAQVNHMLAKVVSDGTGTAAAIDGYTVAGKTGTARKPAENARGYEEGAYIATFAGYVPAENPELAIIVVIDEPRSGIYTAGQVSAPVFARLAQYGLRLFRIPPASGP